MAASQTIATEMETVGQKIGNANFLGSTTVNVNQYHGTPTNQNRDSQFEAERGPSSSKKARHQRLWFDVSRPTDSFYGRVKFLRELQEAIDHSRKSDPYWSLDTHLRVISGLGGVGKTETVKKFIQDHGHQFTNIIWIKAESDQALKDSFTRLAANKMFNISMTTGDGKSQNGKKQMPMILQEIYDALCQQPTLLVFDNAETYVERNCIVDKNGTEEAVAAGGLSQYLPSWVMTPSTSSMTDTFIMVTSRNMDWTPLKNKMVVKPLGPFQEHESVHFIRQQLELNQTDDDDPKNVMQLAQLLGHLPLALSQATAYIREAAEAEKFDDDPANTQFTIEDYIETFEQQNQRRELLDFEPTQREFDRALFTVFNVTLTKIRGVKDHGPLATQIMDILSFLSPDYVPTALIFSIICPDDENNQEKLNKKKTVKKALKLLEKYAMITHHFVDKLSSVRVHRCVQHVIFESLKEPASQNYENGGKIWDILNTSIVPRFGKFFKNFTTTATINSNSQNWSPQALAAILNSGICVLQKFSAIFSNNDGRHCEKNQNELNNFMDFKLEMALGFKISGGFNTALTFLREVFEFSKTSRGPSDPQTVSVMLEIGAVLLEEGRYDECQNFLSATHKVCDSTHDHQVSHPLYKLKCELLIAKVFLQLGHFDVALQMCQEILTDVNAQEGTGHSRNGNILEKMGAKYIMACILSKKCQFLEAEPLYQETYDLQAQFLGVDHRDTINTGNQQAILLTQRGEYEKAHQLFEKVYASRLKFLGVDHPDTITSQNNMGYALQRQGKFLEARSLFEKVMSQQAKIMRPDNPEAIRTKHNMAAVLTKLGHYGRALELLQVVFEQKNKILGAHNPDTISVQNDMAILFSLEGKFNEALSLFEQVHAQQEKFLGCDHPHTISAQCSIGNVFLEFRQYEEAQNLFKKCWIAQVNQDNQAKRKKHAETSFMLYRVAWAMFQSGRYEEALTLCQEEVRPDLVQCFHGDGDDDDEDHHFYLMYVDTLIKRCAVKGRGCQNSDTIKFLKKFIQKMTKNLGPDHPDTLDLLHNLADTFSDHGQYDQALKFYDDVCSQKQRVMGPGHPSTLEALCEKVTILIKLRRYEDGLKLLDEIDPQMTTAPLLSSVERRHPVIFDSQFCRVKVLFYKNRFLEALQLCDKVLEHQKMFLGLNHIDTLKTRRSRALILGRLGRHGEAIEVMQQVEDVMINILGGGRICPEVLNVRRDRGRLQGAAAVAAEDQENFNQALHLMDQVWSHQTEILGTDHPDTIETKCGRADMIVLQKKFEKPIIGS